MNRKIDASHIADLSQLYFAPEEIESLEKDMTELLQIADKLQDFDLTELCLYEDERKSVFREDESTGSLPVSEMIGAAKTSCNGYITVPRVVE